MTYKPFLNEETRTSVLNAVKGGSQKAWSRFFDLYAGYVFSLACRAGLVGQDADDIVQTVFAELAAPGGFDGYDRGKGSFRVWLKTLARWRILDEFRRRSAESVPADLADDAAALPAAHDSSLDEPWIEAVRAEALRRLRAEVSETHFAIFQACVEEDIPTEDVMAMYHVSRDNIYKIKQRTRAAFERHLMAAFDEMDRPEPPL